jgi:hypothetical protein
LKLKKKNRKIKILRAELKEFQVLDRYVKGENVVLKKQVLSSRKIMQS